MKRFVEVFVVCVLSLWFGISTATAGEARGAKIETKAVTKTAIKTATKAVTITVPAPVLLQTLRDALPLPLEGTEKYLQGSVVISSLDDLRIEDGRILLHGILTGTNLALDTNIAGQNLKLNLGSARLPLSCELYLRFDHGTKTLYITPKFPQEAKTGSVDPADAVVPFLNGLAGKEYPVDLGTVAPFSAKVGNRTIPVRLEPVDVRAAKGLLEVQLLPTVTAGKTSKSPVTPGKKNDRNRSLGSH